MYVWERVCKDLGCIELVFGLAESDLSSRGDQVRPPKVVSAAEPACGCMVWPPNLALES